MTQHERSTARRLLLGVTLAIVIVMVLAGTVLAATTTTAGTAVTAATDASAASTATTAADASSGATAGGTQSAAVVTPPSAGFTPLNPGVKVPTVELQIWPEYDSRDVLVFMNLTLPAATKLPATFTYVVPTGARLAGIGEVDPSGNFTYNYRNGPPPTTVGQDGNVVTITLQKYLTVQVEWYYNPGVAVTGARSFPVSVVIPVDTDQVQIAVQQPLRSTNFSVQPPMGQPTASPDGSGVVFNYVSGTVAAVKAGSKVATTISYTKTDSEPSKSTAVSTPTQKSTSKLLIYILVALVVVVVGFSVYRLWLRPAASSGGAGGRSGGARGRGGSGQSGKPTRGAQGSRGAGASRGGGGKAAGGAPTVRADTGGTGVTKFCTNCGARLSKRERFCPECGQEREA